MNDLETNPNPSSESEVQLLRQQVQSLEKVVQTMLAVVLVISLCFTVFLWRQQRSQSKDLADLQPVVKTYDENLAPFITSFIPRLQDYARTHPDINPVLDEFGLRQSAPGQTAPVAVPPASAPTVPKSPAPAQPKK